MHPEATLLPPPPSLFDDDGDEENTSTSRTLEGLGRGAVLGAMIEQRRRSQPCLTSEADEAPESSGPEHRVVTKSGPVRRHSEGFLKVR